MWLITGGCGFIGTNFAHFLKEKKYKFKILDKNKSKYLPNDIVTTIGDVRDKGNLVKIMRDCDVVIHMVTVPPSIRLPRKEIFEIDVRGTQNLLEVATNVGVKRVVFTSSASHVYGLAQQDSCPLKEDAELNPINEYGRNKILSENHCQNVSNDSGLETVILRLSMIIGPYDFDPILRENITSMLNNKPIFIPGNGNQKTQSLHVDDVCSALLTSCENRIPHKSEIINISGNEIISINGLIRIIKDITDSKSKEIRLPLLPLKGLTQIAWWLGKTSVHPSYFQLMDQNQTFDISKAKRVLGWKPKIETETALRDAVHFLQHIAGNNYNTTKTSKNNIQEDPD